MSAGLKKRPISINIAQGLDTKTDPKNVMPGKLTVLENGVYRKNKQIDKRNGFDSIPNVDVSGTELGSGSSIDVFIDELIQYNNQKVYSYSENANAWVDKGAVTSAVVQSRQIIKNTATQSQSDSAVLENVGVYAWEDSRGGVRASVVDETTGTNLLSDVELDSSATRVKCAAFSSYLFVFYYKSGSLYVRRINPLSPTSFDSAVEVSSTVETSNPHYDISPYQDLRMMFAHNQIPIAEVTSITCVADVSDSLDGKTFILQDENGSVAFWFDVDDSGTTIPAEASAADRAVEITTIVTNDSAATVGGKVRTAVDADSKFSTSGADETCIVTDADTGARPSASSSTSGFSLIATTSGVSPSIKVGWLDNAPSVQSGLFPIVYISDPATNCLSIVQGPSNTFYIAYHDGSDVKCTILNNGSTELYAPFSLETIASIRNITGYVVNDSDGVQFLYEVDAAQDYNHYIKECKANDDGTAGSPTVFARSVGLYSKAFSYTDSGSNRYSYVGVAHGSTLQASYFVIRDDGLIVGKQQYTNGGGLTPRSLLATVNNSSAAYSWSILRKIQIVSENATIFTPLGVMKTSVDFANTNNFLAKQQGKNLLIVGGILQMYDGESVVEHGFNLYPENGTATPSTSGGSLADGAYLIYQLYEWTDNYGQIHRSQPSAAITATVSGGGGSGSIAVTAPSLRLTRKDGTNRTNVSIVGYITEVGGTIAYRFTSVSSPTFNDVTADTVSLGTVQSVSTSNEILYTTGGVLPNYSPPACSVIEVFKNRIWIGGLEEADNILYSKENKAGEPVEFAEDFKLAVESQRGRVKAFGVIDDKIIVTKIDRFYNTYGDGPNNTNTLGGFSELEAATIDVGCDNARSIATMTSGIIMKTKKGFYYIDSSLNPLYVGADVEGYNHLSITSATLLTDLNEVRFTTSDGDLLIYNYYFGKWSTATGLKALDAALWGSNYVVLKTDGTILKQSTTKFKDNLDSYRLKFRSGWLSLAGNTSFKRIYELMFVGSYKSNHKLKVSVAYDYSDGWEHTGVYDPVTEFPVTTYGQDSPYGESNTLYGGYQNGYLIRVKLKRQKCVAFRFEVEELTTTATEGTQESLTISDIGVLVGLKKGQGKIAQSRNLGVK